MKKIKAIIFNYTHGISSLIGAVFFLIGIVEIIIGASIPAARNFIFFQGLMFLFIGTMIPSLPFYESITMYILIPIRGKEYFIANIIYSLLINFFAVFSLSIILSFINFFIAIEDFKFIILIMLFYFPIAIAFTLSLCAISVRGGLLRTIIVSIIAYGFPPALATLLNLYLMNSQNTVQTFFEIWNWHLLFLFVYVASLIVVLISYFIGIRNFNKFRLTGFMIKNRRSRLG